MIQNKEICDAKEIQQARYPPVDDAVRFTIHFLCRNINYTDIFFRFPIYFIFSRNLI